MKVALVGAHGSSFDAQILVESLALIPSIRHAKLLDPIDLRDGRDFLKEDLEYDVVILFYIFISSPQEHQKDPLYKLVKNELSYRTSPLHSKDNWRQRLEATRAQEILIFGHFTESELTGEYIGGLPGYVQDVLAAPRGSVWRFKRDHSCQGGQPV